MLIRIVSTTLFFACWFLPGISTAADDVAWLKEIQVPPSNKSAEPVGQFEPLLISKNGQSITTLQEWTTKREQLRSAWMTFLGPMPRRPESVSFTVLKSETIAEGQRELIQYECEPGLMVEAYLLHPDPAKYPFPRPGIVALHQTTDKSIDEIAGLTGPESLQLGPLLAGRGFEVICPRCFLWQTAPTYQAAVESFRKRHPETLGMHKMLYDAMRSVDILVGQPSVDRNRIGTIGHSLGAKEALYLAAFDERIQAAVASEGGLTFPSTNWEAPWYLGHTIKENNFVRNHHELLALIAPRSILILGGESGRGAADGDRSWPLIEQALPIYRLYRKPARIGLLNHRQGHTIPDSASQRMIEWLEIYLK